MRCAQSRFKSAHSAEGMTEQVNAIPNWIHHHGNVIELSLDGIV
jgi:hypothetical protein